MGVHPEHEEEPLKCLRLRGDLLQEWVKIHKTRIERFLTGTGIIYKLSYSIYPFKLGHTFNVSLPQGLHLIPFNALINTYTVYIIDIDVCHTTIPSIIDITR